MPGFEALRQLILADFHERTRRYSFLIVMMGTLFVGFLVITGKWGLTFGDYRGVCNSAWVGSLMGGVSTMMVGMCGFYLVKNSISRDRTTGVGQILATTRLNNFGYLLSKFISNLMVLTVLASALVLAAIAMQLLSKVEGGFDLWDLLAPFLFYCVPMMTIVAAFAVLFDSVGWLKGSIGNVLFFLIAEFAFINHLFFDAPLLDFAGFGLFIPSMLNAALETYPDARLGVEFGPIGFFEDPAADIKTFYWEGIDWSPGMMKMNLIWLGASLGLVGLAALLFDRFDSAKYGRRKVRKPAQQQPIVSDVSQSRTTSAVDWRDISPVEFKFDFAGMLAAELRLMIKSHHWAWFLIAAGLIVVQLLVPYQYALSIALPIAWIWPLAMWSAMGTREARYGTEQFLFSSIRPVSRQYPALWVAGLVMALLTGGGVIIRSLAMGSIDQAMALVIGATFIPSLALALGTVSGSKKLFEAIYLLMWYLGPVNKSILFDYMGVTSTAGNENVRQIYLVATLMLVMSAFLWRRRRVVAGV